MSSYLSAAAIMLLVLSPLFVPVGVTLAPHVVTRVGRIRRVFGLYRRVPRNA
ncbi:hypothetical protein [Mycobacterium sp. URHB0044]|jgi:hypothetical protein|uniref:hypothetical protein n=1 Tax=Mycobacterium sp. URHB0044 TaxID=1380386 RepID=UPI000AAEC4D7|nr:hypothetical protein [Mycobacterium sp. URHB0044]